MIFNQRHWIYMGRETLKLYNGEYKLRISIQGRGLVGHHEKLDHFITMLISYLVHYIPVYITRLQLFTHVRLHQSSTFPSLECDYNFYIPVKRHKQTTTYRVSISSTFHLQL